MRFKLPEYNPNLILELFQTLGYSLWMIQSLELALSSYLNFTHKISTDLAVKEVQQIFEQTSKRTFGSLLRELKEKDDFLSEVVMKRLETLLRDRNWLVHKVYALNQGDMFSDQEAKNLVIRICKIGDVAIELSNLITEKSDKITYQKGFFTKSELDKRTQEIMNSWRKDS